MADPMASQLAGLTGILPILRELESGCTMTEAAERLGVSQPALSRAMARYQQDLSVRLIERIGRGIQLTPEGKSLAAAASQALTIFEPALEDILDHSQSRPIRIGTLRSISGELAPLMVESRRDIRLNVIEGSSNSLLDALLKGSIDAAILGPRPESPLFSWTFLRNQPFVLVVPQSHRLAQYHETSLEGLQHESFVAMAPGYTSRDLADELCSEAGIFPQITVESDNSNTLRTYVGAGIGLCILPEAMVIPDPKIASLRIIRADGNSAYRDIGLVRLAGSPLPPRMQAALRRLVAQLRKE